MIKGKFTLAVFLASLSFAVFPMLNASAASSGNGSLQGTVFDINNNNAPIANQQVVLHEVDKNSETDAATTKTDAGGHYQFSGLSTSSSVQYAVYTVFQGGLYSSGATVSLSDKNSQELDLGAYEATTSDKEIAITQAYIILSEPDAKTGTISAVEAFSFTNLGQKAYVGTTQAVGGQPMDLLRFGLPPGASNLSPDSGFDGAQIYQVDRGMATTAVLPPGNKEIDFAYAFPYSGSSYTLSHDILYPTATLSVLVPPDLKVTAPTLATGGTTNELGQSYQLFEGININKGQTIKIQLSGLPLPPAPKKDLNTYVLLGALAALALLLGGFIFLYIKKGLRVQLRFALPELRVRSLFRHKKPGNSEPEDNLVHRENPGKELQPRQELLAALILLDEDLKSGKIEESDYKKQRDKLKAHLKEILLKEGALAETPEPKSKQEEITV